MVRVRVRGRGRGRAGTAVVGWVADCRPGGSTEWLTERS